MEPQPLYTPHNLNPAYHLRYVWTGWPSEGQLPDEPPPSFWEGLSPLWETDGLRALERRWSGDKVQILFSAKPHVSPVFLAARAKGRLQHALHVSGTGYCAFSRKVAVRSIGDNRIRDVEDYIKGQVNKGQCTDSRFQEVLMKFTISDPSVDLSQPTETRSGRYWYNLHIVLVVESRYRIVEETSLATIRDESLRTAQEEGHRISVLSVLPDHLHIALRGNIERSPEEIALAFQNNTANALGRTIVWRYNYYAGTFGSYDMNAIRRNLTTPVSSSHG